MPNVVGMPVGDALNKLQAAGLTGQVKLVDRKGAPVTLESGGVVTAQSIRPGTRVPADTQITLTIAPDGLG